MATDINESPENQTRTSILDQVVATAGQHILPLGLHFSCCKMRQRYNRAAQRFERDTDPARILNIINETNIFMRSMFVRTKNQRRLLKMNKNSIIDSVDVVSDD